MHKKIAISGEKFVEIAETISLDFFRIMWYNGSSGLALGCAGRRPDRVMGLGVALAERFKKSPGRTL